VHQNVKKYVTHVTLVILKVDKDDFGTFSCVAKTPLGESDGIIKLTGESFPVPFYYLEIISVVNTFSHAQWSDGKLFFSISCYSPID
jgi:hypothetical protein